MEKMENTGNQSRIIINTDQVLIQYGQNTFPELDERYKPSEKLKTILDEAVQRINPNGLINHFYKIQLILNGLVKGFILKKRSGKNYGDYFLKTGELIRVYPNDAHKGLIKINWTPVILYGTNYIALYPLFTQGYAQGLLEKLGLVKMPCYLPLLKEPTVLGGALTINLGIMSGQEQQKTIFSYSETKELIRNLRHSNWQANK